MVGKKTSFPGGKKAQAEANSKQNSSETEGDKHKTLGNPRKTRFFADPAFREQASDKIPKNSREKSGQHVPSKTTINNSTSLIRGGNQGTQLQLLFRLRGQATRHREKKRDRQTDRPTDRERRAWGKSARACVDQWRHPKAVHPQTMVQKGSL